MNKKNPLTVVNNKPPLRANRRQQMEGTLEQIWKNDSKRFNPERNCLEKERINRTWQLISESMQLIGKKVVDLGSGYGLITKKLIALGAKVTSLDIAYQALEFLKDEPNIVLKREYIPFTTLPDDSYDLVVCTDVIAYLPGEDYRLFFSELARLVNKEGYVICSSGIDINSDDALENFLALAQTEFDIEDWVLSYHRLHIKLTSFFEAPKRFVRASKEPFFREEALKTRKGLSHKWIDWNSKAFMPYLWRCFAWLFYPITYLLDNNRTLLLFLERLSKSIWQEEAVSHIIFLGKRRPLIESPRVDQIPEERKGKKQVWE